MKISPKVSSILVVALLGIGGMAALTAAWGDPGMGTPHRSAWSGGMGPGHGWRFADASSWQGHGWYRHCAHAMGGPGFKGRGAWRTAFIAGKLNALETEIGIRANQLDAWRDFTDSLLAVVQPPSALWQDQANTGEKAEPFALAQGLADNVIARAKNAEDLKKAIATLRTTLTPEQLDKVAEIEARFRSFHGHGPDFGQSPDQGTSGDKDVHPDQPDGSQDSKPDGDNPL